MSKRTFGELGSMGTYLSNVVGVADGGGCAYCDKGVTVDGGFVIRDVATCANVCIFCAEKLPHGGEIVDWWSLTEHDRQVEAGMDSLMYSVEGHTKEVDRILAGDDDMPTLAHCEQQARYIGILVKALLTAPPRFDALTGLMARLEERARAVGAALGESVDSDAFTTEQ